MASATFDGSPVIVPSSPPVTNGKMGVTPSCKSAHCTVRPATPKASTHGDPEPWQLPSDKLTVTLGVPLVSPAVSWPVSCTLEDWSPEATGGIVNVAVSPTPKVTCPAD